MPHHWLLHIAARSKLCPGRVDRRKQGVIDNGPNKREHRSYVIFLASVRLPALQLREDAGGRVGCGQLSQLHGLLTGILHSADAFALIVIMHRID